jgi:hypothetical protein
MVRERRGKIDCQAVNSGMNARKLTYLKTFSKLADEKFQAANKGHKTSHSADKHRKVNKTRTSICWK